MMIKNLLSYLKLKIKYKNSFINLNCTTKYGSNITLDNNCRIGKKCDISHFYIGRYSYIGNYCKMHGVQIGNFTSIGNNVKIISGNHPTSIFVSTSPVFYSVKNQCGESFVSKNLFDEYKYFDKVKKIHCIIGNDVWIGDDVKILEGVEIGDGAVIAAGAVVNKNVPPYAMVGGVPAKVIKYRFEDEIITKLNKIQWWNKDINWIKENSEKFKDISIFLK